jgi:putative redox protein
MGSPADFDDWAHSPRRLLLHARDGHHPFAAFPQSFDSWSRELRDPRRGLAPRLWPRSLLVLHGSDDESVPVFDARVLADAHGDADLRVIDGAGHQLRHDLGVAVMLGWLDRQRNGQRRPLLNRTSQSVLPAGGVLAFLNSRTWPGWRPS